MRQVLKSNLPSYAKEFFWDIRERKEWKKTHRSCPGKLDGVSFCRNGKDHRKDFLDTLHSRRTRKKSWEF
jgi:hypothetical protein